MTSTERPRSFLLFYLLMVYILIQFAWWAWMLLDLNKEVITLQGELQALQVDPEASGDVSNLSGRVWMIVGEGSVFLVLLMFGFWRIRRTHRKEMALASQQRNFLMSITHELKSPLASIKLYLQTILKRDLEATKQEEIIQKTIKDTDRLHALVENILIATRIDNSSMPLHQERTNLSELVRELIDGAAESIGKDHRTTLDLAPEVFVAVDHLAFSSILLNLYENAIKYSPAGKEVTVKLTTNGGLVTLAVRDEGNGIPANEDQRIYEKFYRIGDESTRRTKGTGLGLYIVKSLVNLHGGTVRVKSNQPQGAIFEVSLREN